MNKNIVEIKCPYCNQVGTLTYTPKGNLFNEECYICSNCYSTYLIEDIIKD